MSKEQVSGGHDAGGFAEEEAYAVCLAVESMLHASNVSYAVLFDSFYVVI